MNWFKFFLGHRSVASWFWSFSFLVLVLFGIGSALTLFPITGVFIMIFGVIYFPVLGGCFLVLIFTTLVESLWGRIPRVLCLLPIIIIGGYYQSYFQNQQLVDEVYDQSIPSISAEKITRLQLKYSDNVSLPKYGEYSLLKEYGLSRIYTQKDNVDTVKFLAENQVCQQLVSDHSELLDHYVSVTGYSRYGESGMSVGIFNGCKDDCLVGIKHIDSGEVDLTISIEPVEFDEYRHFKIEGYRSQIVTGDENLKLRQIKINKLPFLPMPAMGCYLVSNPAQWKCESWIVNDQDVVVGPGSIEHISRTIDDVISLENLGFRKKETKESNLSVILDLLKQKDLAVARETRLEFERYVLELDYFSDESFLKRFSKDQVTLAEEFADEIDQAIQGVPELKQELEKAYNQRKSDWDRWLKYGRSKYINKCPEVGHGVCERVKNPDYDRRVKKGSLWFDQEIYDQKKAEYMPNGMPDANELNRVIRELDKKSDYLKNFLEESETEISSVDGIKQVMNNLLAERLYIYDLSYYQREAVRTLMNTEPKYGLDIAADFFAGETLSKNEEQLLKWYVFGHKDDFFQQYDSKLRSRIKSNFESIKTKLDRKKYLESLDIGSNGAKMSGVDELRRAELRDLSWTQKIDTKRSKEYLEIEFLAYLASAVSSRDKDRRTYYKDYLYQTVHVLNLEETWVPANFKR